MYALQKAEIKIAERIKIANQCTLKEIHYPGLSGGANALRRVFEVEEGLLESV